MDSKGYATVATLVVTAAIPFHNVHAQDTAATRLEPVVIEVGRGAHRSLLRLPFAVTAQTPDSMRPGQRHLSLDETLWLIPGLSVSNRNNPSQDAGGGVVDIRTSEPLPVPVSGAVRFWSGAYGTRRLVAKTAGATDGFGYQANAARTESDGYRDYSRQRTNNGFARVSYDNEEGSYALEWLGVHTPVAENPGAITRAQFDLDPRMADPLSIRKSARKAVTQSQFGLTARRTGSRSEIEASGYLGTRALDNPLTFAIVDLGRTMSGGNVRATIPFSLLAADQRFTIGTEVQLQNDLRRNFTNCNNIPRPTIPTATCPDTGVERGTLTLDQREIVSSIGSYVRDELDLGERYTFTASARADAVRFRVKDRLINATNPDDSGRRLLHAISPMVGLLARLSDSHSAYANISSAFETPTATELGNQPSGAGGINRDLKPQRSTTYELGFKGAGTSGLQYNAALFATAVHDELIPFDIPASGGRRYFRNAGRTSRRGLELGLGAALRQLEIGGAYTYANYRFVDFTVDTAHYAGNRIPGIPRQAFQASAALHNPLATLVMETTLADRMFVNDVNSESSPGYGIVNARIISGAALGVSSAELTMGVQNLFDKRWVSSVSVNAAGGKFYEPASQRSLYVGLSLLGAPKSSR